MKRVVSAYADALGIISVEVAMVSGAILYARKPSSLYLATAVRSVLFRRNISKRMSSALLGLYSRSF